MSHYREEPTTAVRQSRLGMDDLKVMGVLALGLLIILAGAVAGLWLLTARMEPEAVRAWAVAATLLLPLIGLGCFKWGHTEARGRLRGMDDGLGKVVQAANAAIDLRAKHAVTIKQSMSEPSPYVVLPAPEPSFTMRPQLTAGDVVELE